MLTANPNCLLTHYFAKLNRINIDCTYYPRYLHVDILCTNEALYKVSLFLKIRAQLLPVYRSSNTSTESWQWSLGMRVSGWLWIWNQNSRGRLSNLQKWRPIVKKLADRLSVSETRWVCSWYAPDVCVDCRWPSQVFLLSKAILPIIQISTSCSS